MSRRNVDAKVMARMEQSSYRKVEKGETSKQAVQREVMEETNLHIVPKFLLTDPKFNCDIYICEVPHGERAQHMEPEKNGPWIIYL